MLTVKQVSRLTGVSVRTLQYYDRIDLLKPAGHSKAGYRLYDENDLEKLEQILLFRELEFSLKEIKEIIESPDFDKDKALRQQIKLLELRREHIDNLIKLAGEIRNREEGKVDFKAFDRTKMEDYAKRAKEQWGKTDAYREFEEKDRKRTDEDNMALADQMMEIFSRFGKIKDGSPKSEEAFKLVRSLQSFITENYYECTDEILFSLGKAYGSGGEFTENINLHAGKGTAEFASMAIEEYSKTK